jgi:hypothetical protein
MYHVSQDFQGSGRLSRADQSHNKSEIFNTRNNGETLETTCVQQSTNMNTHGHHTDSKQ